MRRHQAADAIVADATVEGVGRQFAEVNGELDRMLEGAVQVVQAMFDRLAGQECGPLAGREVANQLQAILNRLGLRVACPRDGCGKPATIRHKQIRPGGRGTFLFEHDVNGRYMTHSASITLPPVAVVPHRPDCRRNKHGTPVRRAVGG